MASSFFSFTCWKWVSLLLGRPAFRGAVDLVGFVDKSSVDLVPGSEFLVDCADVSGALLSDCVCVSGALVSVLELMPVLATFVTVSDRAMVPMERFLSRRLARLLAALRLRNCFVDSVTRTMNCVSGDQKEGVVVRNVCVSYEAAQSSF